MRFLLVQGFIQQSFALQRCVVIVAQRFQDVLLLVVHQRVNLFEPRLQPLHSGKIGAVLALRVQILRVKVGTPLGQFLQGAVLAELWNDVEVPALSELIESFLAHAVTLRVSHLPVQIGKALRGYVLLVIQLPNLMFSLVGQASVF